MRLNTEEHLHVQKYVVESGLTFINVQEDVIDHLCCIVEEKFGEGADFNDAFDIAKSLITKEDIQQIQEDTHYYLTIKKQVIMIKAMFISAYASLVFLVSGILFIAFGDILHLPDIIGFSMLLGSVAIFSLGFLPTLFFHKYKRYIEQIKA